MSNEILTQTETASLETLGFPMGATIEHICRAIRIVSDSGGKVRLKDIKTSFGTKSSDKVNLSRGLNSAVSFGLLDPHSTKTPYVLSEIGKKFLSSKENLQKKYLMHQFLGFVGYSKVLIAMKNDPDKSIKKKVITDMWLQIRDNVKIRTRESYTLTFSSVGSWCGAIDDSGYTCSLTPEGEKILEQVLNGVASLDGAHFEMPSKPVLSPKAPVIHEATSDLSGDVCPHCGKSETGVEDEELLDRVTSNDVHTLILKTTYFCRGCSRSFSRIKQRTIN